MSIKYALIATAFAIAGASLAMARQATPSRYDPPTAGMHIMVPNHEMKAYVEGLKRAKPFVEQGQTEERQGAYAQAEADFRQALAIAPLDYVARLELGKVCERQGKIQEALSAYREVVYPGGRVVGTINTDFTARLRYILALVRTRTQWKEAFTMYAQATAGSQYAPAGRFDQERPDYAGMEAVAHYLLGVSSPHWGPPDPDEQREHLMAAIALRPNWALAHLACGRSLYRAKQYPQARAELLKAEALDQGEVHAEAQKAIQKLDLRVRYSVPVAAGPH